MPRSPRADEAGGLYHALNRGNARATIFQKDSDYEAFERILSEGLDRYDVQLFAYQLLPNHWHFVLRPNQDGEMSQFMRWVTATHTMRYHAHYHSSGEGHVYQCRFKSFPIQEENTFSRSAVTWSAMPCGRRTGDGVRYGVGFRRCSLTHRCCLPGRFHACLVG